MKLNLSTRTDKALVVILITAFVILLYQLTLGGGFTTAVYSDKGNVQSVGKDEVWILLAPSLEHISVFAANFTIDDTTGMNVGDNITFEWTYVGKNQRHIESWKKLQTAVT